jgi:hypothetical protein
MSTMTNPITNENMHEMKLFKRFGMKRTNSNNAQYNNFSPAVVEVTQHFAENVIKAKDFVELNCGIESQWRILICCSSQRIWSTPIQK